MESFKSKILFEHRFWLQILGDHSRFILNALSSKEKELIETAKSFITLFDDLLTKARGNLNEEELSNFNMEAYNSAEKLRSYKLSILGNQIAGEVSINLPPTFINHMVNEVEEYLLILSFIIQGQIENFSSTHHHLLWLLDGSGHAASIASNLDMTEKGLIEQSREFEKQFMHLYHKADEFRGYKRTGIKEFNALDELDKDAYAHMSCFKNFLEELEALVQDKRVLGIIKPLMLDHMAREECYYLNKLAEVSKVNNPKCDPGKPRI